MGLGGKRGHAARGEHREQGDMGAMTRDIGESDGDLGGDGTGQETEEQEGTADLGKGDKKPLR